MFKSPRCGQCHINIVIRFVYMYTRMSTTVLTNSYHYTSFFKDRQHNLVLTMCARYLRRFQKRVVKRKPK